MLRVKLIFHHYRRALSTSAAAAAPVVSVFLPKWHSVLKKVAPTRAQLLPPPLGSDECNLLAVVGDSCLHTAIVTELFPKENSTPGSITLQLSHVLSNAILSELADELLVIPGINITSKDLQTLSVHARATSVEAAAAVVYKAEGFDPLYDLVRCLLELRAPPSLCTVSEFISLGGTVTTVREKKGLGQNSAGHIAKATYRNFVVRVVAASKEAAEKNAIAKLLALVGSESMRKSGKNSSNVVESNPSHPLLLPASSNTQPSYLPKELSRHYRSREENKEDTPLARVVHRLGGSFSTKAIPTGEFIVDLQLAKISVSSQKSTKRAICQQMAVEKFISVIEKYHRIFQEEAEESDSENLDLSSPFTAPVSLLSTYTVQCYSKPTGGFVANAKLGDLFITSEAAFEDDAKRSANKAMLASILSELRTALSSLPPLQPVQDKKPVTSGKISNSRHTFGGLKEDDVATVFYKLGGKVQTWIQSEGARTSNVARATFGSLSTTETGRTKNSAMHLAITQLLVQIEKSTTTAATTTATTV